MTVYGFRRQYGRCPGCGDSFGIRFDESLGRDGVMVVCGRCGTGRPLTEEEEESGTWAEITHDFLGKWVVDTVWLGNQTLRSLSRHEGALLLTAALRDEFVPGYKGREFHICDDDDAYFLTPSGTSKDCYSVFECIEDCVGMDDFGSAPERR